QGMQGYSHGWFNHTLIQKTVPEVPAAYIGGESRFWLGPEYGQFSVFFDPGAEQVEANQRAPHDLDWKRFELIDRDSLMVSYGGQMKVINAAGYEFDLKVMRRVKLLTSALIQEKLKLESLAEVAQVAFETETVVENYGNDPFDPDSGLIAIWELGCMHTSPENVVIIPLDSDSAAITEYFTPLGERGLIRDKTLFYRADAEGINKIGILPADVRPLMGSYDPSRELLSVVTFSFYPQDSLYVNSLPENKAPYAGDVINIFNGEVVPEINRDIPFFEFESSSSAGILHSGDQMYHRQSTYHFEGSPEALSPIAEAVFGLRLDQIPKL
ncbi:MAG: DUF6786 family protein, partial [Bacteroidota bacterium]